MTDLTKSIQDLYQDQISQEEAEIASCNLISFFKILQGIDERRQRKIDIAQNVNNEVIKTYEHNRSTNRIRKTK
jgi:hypothetical protein